MRPLSDTDVVIVEAARSPMGRRNGGLASVHPADLLAEILGAVVVRSGIDPEVVGQVVGGCVTQTGEQTFNVTRTAWLRAGLPIGTGRTYSAMERAEAGMLGMPKKRMKNVPTGPVTVTRMERLLDTSGAAVTVTPPLASV